MNSPVPDTLLEPFSQFVGERMGLNFPPERWPDLARGIGAAAREFGFQDAAACARWLLSAPLTDSRMQALARHLTIGETYFLRDQAVFAFLAEQILPELVRERQQRGRCLRFWSAGCATGEEPYSIAILLRQAVPDIAQWNFTILGTDLNPASLSKAAQGIYSDWSFRDLPAEFRARYFKELARGRYQILPALQQMVSFAVLNLAEDSYPALWSNTNAMDVIFCRNVLMYFTPAQAKKAVANLHRCLVEGGWLIVGASEASQSLFAGFRTVHTPAATFYRKTSSTINPDRVLSMPTPGDASLGPESTSSFHLGGGPQTESEVSPRESFAAGELPTSAPPPSITSDDGSAEQPGADAAVALPDALEDAATLLTLARAHANQGRLSEALGLCEKAVASDRLNPVCHYLRAAILLESGATREAVKGLRQTLYLDPRFILAHFVLGSHARREGQLPESARHFKNTLALLRAYRPEELVPEAEGITAGRMKEIVDATLQSEEVR